MMISAFEHRHHIVLPTEYRDHVIAAPDPELLALHAWCHPYYEYELPLGFLAQPFPHVEAWNDLSLFAAEKGWDCPYYSMLHATGSIRIMNRGCEEYAILVVTGPERGKVWIDARASGNAGIRPVCTADGHHATFCEYMGMERSILLDQRPLALTGEVMGRR